MAKFERINKFYPDGVDSPEDFKESKSRHIVVWEMGYKMKYLSVHVSKLLSSGHSLRFGSISFLIDERR